MNYYFFCLIDNIIIKIILFYFFSEVLWARNDTCSPCSFNAFLYQCYQGRTRISCVSQLFQSEEKAVSFTILMRFPVEIGRHRKSSLNILFLISLDFFAATLNNLGNYSG